MTTKYKIRVKVLEAKITPVECVREATRVIWLAPAGPFDNERRVEKRGAFDHYYDSWAEAHQALRGMASAAHAEQCTRLIDALGLWLSVDAMREPTE